MTNFEKWKDKILAITSNDDEFAVNDGALCRCSEIACTECDFHEPCCKHRYEWLYAEYVEPEIDWSKVPIDTKILVRDLETDPWCRRYFAGYVGGIVYAWADGATEWSHTSKLVWKYAKLADEET